MISLSDAHEGPFEQTVEPIGETDDQWRAKQENGERQILRELERT